MAAPSLWVTVACTVMQITLLLWAIVHFYDFISFCKAVNRSGKYGAIRGWLVLLMYIFAPITIISVTFSWIAYDQDWVAGFVFVWLPFALFFLFVMTVVITKNDVSNFVDIQREARAKLPFQPPPPTLVVDEPIGAAAPEPPVLPIHLVGSDIV